MTSYLHACHAGNHADVLKHVVLMLVLDRLVRQDPPSLFLDTHAGAGRYDLPAERCIARDASRGGMTGSGMIVINPPWPLAEARRMLLPCLQHVLAGPDGGFRLLPLAAEAHAGGAHPFDRSTPEKTT
jgi:23S rRNA (adenine2030-N6)-methyltransferase